jgi:hypothetical protein
MGSGACRLPGVGLPAIPAGVLAEQGGVVAGSGAIAGVAVTSSRSTCQVQAMGWLRGLEVTVGGTGSVSRALVPLRALADKTKCGCAVPPAGWAPPGFSRHGAGTMKAPRYGSRGLHMGL